MDLNHFLKKLILREYFYKWISLEKNVIKPKELIEKKEDKYISEEDNESLYDKLVEYRSDGEESTVYEGSENSEDEEEYQAYDEYYFSYPDGGYFLYCDDYLLTIPGYALFCADQTTKSRGELNCLWKELKENNHSKYHEYIQKHKEQDPGGFYKFRRHQTYYDRCLYPKKLNK